MSYPHQCLMTTMTESRPRQEMTCHAETMQNMRRLGLRWQHGGFQCGMMRFRGNTLRMVANTMEVASQHLILWLL